jgi:hypothetical protein
MTIFGALTSFTGFGLAFSFIGIAMGYRIKIKS